MTVHIPGYIVSFFMIVLWLGLLAVAMWDLWTSSIHVNSKLTLTLFMVVASYTWGRWTHDVWRRE